MTKTFETIMEVTGVVRIGRGVKLHPAIKRTVKDEKGKLSTAIIMSCHCPNSQNGFGNGQGTFYSHFDPNYKG
jgi:hypothetical protein